MNILIIADPFIPVPPQSYGGTERIIYYIGSEFVRQGHTVHLLAGKGTQAFNGRVVVHYPPTLSRWSRAFRKLFFQWLCWWHFRKVDVIINFARVDYLIAFRAMRRKMLCVFSNPVSAYEDNWILNSPNIIPIGITKSHISGLKSRNRFRIINNAIYLSLYTFRENPGNYLAFLGRLTYNKGVDLAIKVAMEAGIPLKIAGNISSEEGQSEYYETQVKPFIGGLIEYVGEVDDVKKNELLGNALATLFPIRWNEPFGLVMIESMACGTPVIALNRASVPEVITHGINGYVCDDLAGMVKSVGLLNNINRYRCRQSVEERYTVPVMAEQFENLFPEVVRQ